MTLLEKPANSTKDNSSQVDVAEQIVSASWIVTVNKSFDVLENHALVFGAGKILDILPTSEIQDRYPDLTQTHLQDQALLPGFINAHTHAAMSLLKGFADDQPLHKWLQDFVWPVEGKWVSHDFVFDGAELACAEMIKSGTTCFNDMYFFPDAVAEVTKQAQMRACLSSPILEFPSVWANNADEYIHKALALHDDLRLNPLIHTAFGPHAPYTVKIETLQRVHTLAEELDVNIHMHVHETEQEIIDYEKEHGMSPVRHYAERDLLSPRFQAVHMTQLQNAEIDLLAINKVKVIHCPESNLKLASGMCPINDLLKAGISIAIGTDGSASNNDLDMIGEVKTAALMAKMNAGNAAELPAQKALSLATIEGAKTLGLENLVGSLENGKQADFISIDLSGINSQPVYNPVSQIVYTAAKDQVSNVWVNGKQLLSNGQLTTLDENSILTKAQSWKSKIAP